MQSSTLLSLTVAESHGNQEVSTVIDQDWEATWRQRLEARGVAVKSTDRCRINSGQRAGPQEFLLLQVPLLYRWARELCKAEIQGPGPRPLQW